MVARTVIAVFVVIVLTTPDGQPIWVQSEHIQSIRGHGGNCHERSGSMIRFDNGGTLCARETPRDIYDKVQGK